MRVPDEIRKSVFFVCVQVSATQPSGNQQFMLAGTGFFLGIEEKEINTNFVYMVTAKHVIDAVRKHSIDGNVYLRLNTVSGGAQFVRSPLTQWTYHLTDSSVDVAAIAFAPPQDTFEYLLIPGSMAMTDKHPDYQFVGVGDEVFVTGMFVNHVGRQRNIPIIRTGNIAMLPEEPIETKYGASEVYLIESRSIGGLSGSPVFRVKSNDNVTGG